MELNIKTIPAENILHNTAYAPNLARLFCWILKGVRVDGENQLRPANHLRQIIFFFFFFFFFKKKKHIKYPIMCRNLPVVPRLKTLDEMNLLFHI